MMQGKVVIVTGATNGIGEVAAREIAARGATTVLISRTESKLKNTVNNIKSLTGNTNVSYIQADLSDMAQVKAAAEQFLAEYDRLDVLLNNAGAMFLERKLSNDGYEMTFALNHLNYFLLTQSLLDVLKQTADKHGEARIINVSSNAHRMGRVNFADIQREENYSWTVYGETKLMNLYFTYALDRRLEDTNVTVNALHPGLVKTGFGKSNNIFVSAFMNVFQAFGKTAEEGAETLIYLATTPEVQGVSGKYWYECKQIKSSSASYDQAAQERLWTLSETWVAKALESDTPQPDEAHAATV